MFGKTRDIYDTDPLDTSALGEFFGDEAAAENSAEIIELRDRVQQVELQISSQFTSLATYAQIAQEQVELARAEAKAATDRSEHRLTTLIERERADRIASFTGVAPEGSSDITPRLDALEHSVALIQEGLDDCRRQQRELATAITAMFEWLTSPAPAARVSDAGEGSPLPPPAFTASNFPPPSAFDSPSPAPGYDGLISGLSLS